jgi:hypothetical protein
VCIGDFWAASEGLDDLIIRIGRMISYQEYNTKSPLNGLAAKWAEQHAKLFPVDPRDIAPPTEKAVAPTAEPVPGSNGTAEAVPHQRTTRLQTTAPALARHPIPGRIAFRSNDDLPIPLTRGGLPDDSAFQLKLT